MPSLGQQLELDRCPHCGVSRPNLRVQHSFITQSLTGRGDRQWDFYVCARCGGVVTAGGAKGRNWADYIFPRPAEVEDAVPSPAKDYLQQALESLHAPAGAIMLAASSVDAMLKVKGYESGSLYSRIDKAAEEHVITLDMAAWAHEVRLNANEQRHADSAAPLPTGDDARHVVDFVVALAQILFVLPSKIQKGIQEAGGETNASPQAAA